MSCLSYDQARNNAFQFTVFKRTAYVGRKTAKAVT